MQLEEYRMKMTGEMVSGRRMRKRCHSLLIDVSLRVSGWRRCLLIKRVKREEEDPSRKAVQTHLSLPLLPVLTRFWAGLLPPVSH